MRKKNKNIEIFIILAVVVVLFLKLGGFFSAFSGTAYGSRFIYINTYNATSLKQMGATVTLGNYSCNTQLQGFNLGYPVIEYDMPLQQGQQPLIYDYYTSGSSPVPISYCLITLNSNLIGNTITFSLKAFNTSSIYSKTYLANATIVNNQYPILFTVPLQTQAASCPNNAACTSIITSTTTSTSSTLAQGQSSSTSISSTSTSSSSTTTTIPQAPGLIQSFWQWLTNLINMIFGTNYH